MKRPGFDEEAARAELLKNEAELLKAEVAKATARAEKAEAMLEEREADMHMRIRAGYDKTVADAWKTEVAKVTARAEKAEKELARVLALPVMKRVVVWSVDRQGKKVGIYDWEVCGTCGRPPNHEGRCDSFDRPAPDHVKLHPID